MSEQDQIRLRIRMLRHEADGCRMKVVDWEMGVNNFKRDENIEALRLQAITLEARADGLAGMLEK